VALDLEGYGQRQAILSRVIIRGSFISSLA
jgi:hypothetical protein